MSEFERLSITVDKKRAAKLRELVDKGFYPSVSRAFDAAAEALIDLEGQRAAWWAETMRRCDEADAHPDRLLTADQFFASVREDIAADKVQTAPK